MNKKMVLSLALGALLTFGGMGAAFAADAQDTATTNPTLARGNGVKMYTTAASVEELLEQKIAAIDKMVEDERLTQEEADNYKKLITERMNNCTTVGENRENNERLGIGFGRGQGQGQGLRNGSGFGRMNGMGFGRNAVNNN